MLGPRGDLEVTISNTAMTFSDAGAHVGEIYDASIRTHLITVTGDSATCTCYTVAPHHLPMESDVRERPDQAMTPKYRSKP
jgi:hypothetical protein